MVFDAKVHTHIAIRNTTKPAAVFLCPLTDSSKPCFSPLRFPSSTFVPPAFRSFLRLPVLPLRSLSPSFCPIRFLFFLIRLPFFLIRLPFCLPLFPHSTSFFPYLPSLFPYSSSFFCLPDFLFSLPAFLFSLFVFLFFLIRLPFLPILPRLSFPPSLAPFSTFHPLSKLSSLQSCIHNPLFQVILSCQEHKHCRNQSNDRSGKGIACLLPANFRQIQRQRPQRLIL